MGKRFKFRISRVLPSFQSCRSKDPSTLPSNPTFLRLTPPNPKLVNFHFSAITPSPAPLPSSKHCHSSLRHVSLALISVCYGFRSRASLSEDDQNDFRWQRRDQWHVVARFCDDNTSTTTTPHRKIYNSSVSDGSGSDDDDVSPRPPPQRLIKRQRVRKKRPKSRVRLRTSSADSCGFSSSDDGNEERDIDEEETETLVSSSRSFATDSSSELNHHLEIIHEGRKKKQKQRKKVKKEKKAARRSVSMAQGTRNNSVPSSPESVPSPARLSMLQRLITCRVEGKVRESFAVVKRSEDPYEDFRRSMMEMILEKQMFEEKDLEQLLHCFLSLNSSEHHGTIVEAFAEIWEALFCTTRPN